MNKLTHKGIDMKTKILLLFCVFLLYGGITSTFAEELNINEKRTLREDDDPSEIVAIQDEIRQSGRLKWWRFYLHPVLGIGWTFDNNLTVGTKEDENTGQPFAIHQHDHYFSISPGFAVTFGHDYLPLSAGYRGDFGLFTRYGEFNGREHTAFFRGKFLRQYWRVLFQGQYKAFSQEGKKTNQGGTVQTTDKFDSEYTESKITLEIDLPPFLLFKDSAFLFRIGRHDDVAQGQKTHFTNYQIGMRASLSEFFVMEVLGGFEFRRYGVRSSPGLLEFKDFQGFVGSLKLKWELCKKSSLSFESGGALQDDSFVESGYKYVQFYKLKYERELRKHLAGALAVGLDGEEFGRSNRTNPLYPFKTRKDWRYVGSLEITYQVNSWSQIRGTYTYIFISSNMSDFTTPVHQVSILTEIGF